MELILLPSELLVATLVDLDFRDLLRCREVSTKFKALIDDDARAQYKLELAIAGMEDGATSSSTTAERLSILRNRQNAWSNFTWSAKENVPMRTGDVWELYGNILAQSEGERTIHVKQIPSAIRGIEGTEWTIPDVGCNITEIGIDPAQDLLLVVEHFEDETGWTCRIHLHLRSLSTGTLHPAASPTGMLTHEPELGGYSYGIQISENTLGVLMSSQDFGDASELLIWDWKTGTLHLRITGTGLHSFAFLTSRFLLLAHGGEGADDPQFLVIDLESPQPSSSLLLSEVKYLCAFHYPPLRDDLTVLDVLIRSDPAPNWRPAPALAVPFSVSRADRLFVVTLWLIEYDDETNMFSLVPASTFLRAIDSLAPGETGRHFAWAEWGPRGSRFIAAPSTYTSTEVWYGAMFATVEQELDPQTGRFRKSVVVRDFNQLAVRKAIAAAGEKESSSGGNSSGLEEGVMRVVLDATVFEPTGVFEEEVTTALPYVERIFVPKEEDGEFNAVLLAEDAMVLVTGTWQSPLRYRILSI